jgi:hypothetical protein
MGAFQIHPAPESATKAVYTISIMQREVFQLFTHGVYIIFVPLSPRHFVERGI